MTNIKYFIVVLICIIVCTILYKKYKNRKILVHSFHYTKIKGIDKLYNYFKEQCDSVHKSTNLDDLYSNYSDHMKWHYDNCTKLPDEKLWYKREGSNKGSQIKKPGISDNIILTDNSPYGIYDKDCDIDFQINENVKARNGHLKIKKDDGLIELIQETFGSNLESNPTGYFWYPPKGFRNWHTNRLDRRGWRIYLTYTYEDDQSWMSYKDINTHKLETVPDRNGYINMFHINTDEDEEDILWHSIYSMTDRFSMGFHITDAFAQELINNRLVEIIPNKMAYISKNLQGLYGWHSCRNKWALEPNKHHTLNLISLSEIIQNRTPVLIQHKYISWKGKDNPQSKMDSRYEYADPTYPGILCENGPNPHNLPYRMVDGSHRIIKLIQNGFHTSSFYIITFEEFCDRLFEVM